MYLNYHNIEAEKQCNLIQFRAFNGAYQYASRQGLSNFFKLPESSLGEVICLPV